MKQKKATSKKTTPQKAKTADIKAINLKTIQIKEMQRLLKVFIISSLVVLVALILALGLWQINIAEVPLKYGSDGTWNVVRQKILIEESGLGYTASRMGFPFGHESYDFTTGSFLPLVWQKLWSFVTDNPILGLNLSYLAGYFLITWISIIVLIKLGIEDNIAIAVSILYAFLPYHIMRGTAHNALSFYVTIPIVVYYIIKLMDEQSGKVKKSTIVIWIALMLLSGMNGVYYAFFSCLFLGIAFLYNIINKNDKKNIIGCILSIAIIVLGLVLSMLPSLIYWQINGKAEAIIRPAIYVVTYALRISQMILPIYNHRNSFLADLTNKYNELGLTNENAYAALGLVFSIGFLALCLSVLKRKDKSTHREWGKLVALTLCGVVYGSVGGLVEIQAGYFSLIRCSNRISVFLAFFACIAVAILIQKILEKRKWLGKKIVYWILIAIVCVGVYDQTPKVNVQAYEERLEILNSLEAFVDEIEESYPSIAILQFPYAVYPEAGKMNKMEDYSHAAPYIFSDSLQWSYGGINGREGDVLISRLTELDVPEMIKQAAAVGFEGIYIDRYGYLSEKVLQLENQLYEILQQEPIVSTDERYVFFSLEKYIEDNAIEYDSNVENSLLCVIKNGKNVYKKEKNDTDNWFWAQNESELIIVNHSEETMKFNLTGNLAFYSGIQGTVTMKGAGCKETLERGDFSVMITVEPGENVIQLSSTNKNNIIESGIRTVCFQLINCNLELLETNGLE